VETRIRNFFHKFDSFRRNKNHIWETRDENGDLHAGQGAIKLEATIYFKTFYLESNLVEISDQVDTMGLYDCIVKAKDAMILDNPCTKVEIWEVLKSFAKDKSPRPDGWTVEFLIHYFDIFGADLLELVEDSRIHGFVNKSLNVTFMTLIPKVNNPTSFGDFRPIALCNLCYMMISKVIENMITHVLSRMSSEEQLGCREIGTHRVVNHSPHGSPISDGSVNADFPLLYRDFATRVLQRSFLQLPSPEVPRRRYYPCRAFATSHPRNFWRKSSRL
jgi:hypothetical protein